MSTEWDAVVVGGGPAGALSAYVLARAGRRVILVEPRDRAVRRIGETIRGAAAAILRSLGLDGILSGRHLPSFGNASSWGSSDLVPTDFIHDPHGVGFHLDRMRFDADLRDAARDAGAAVKSARLREATRASDLFSLRFDDGSVARAPWVVDASGRRALVARSQGAKVERDDLLVAIHTWLAPEVSDQETRTVVESTSEGWWYTAALPGRERVVSLHVDSDQAAKILRTPGRFEALLSETSHLRNVVAGRALLTRPKAVQAAGARLDRFAGDGWVAAGDAAVAFDPISSQGLFNALYTGMKSAQLVHTALSGQPSAAIGDYIRRLEDVRSIYRTRQALAYGVERRWPEAPFWLRRSWKPRTLDVTFA